MTLKFSKLAIFALISAATLGNNQAWAGGKEKGGKKTYAITADIAKMPEQMVVLELLRANDSVKVIDSQRSDAAGHVVFAGTLNEPSLFRLHFTENKFILLSIDKEPAKISASWPFTNYIVESSAPSQQLKVFIDTVITYMTLLNLNKAATDSVKRLGNAELVAVAEKDKEAITTRFKNTVKKYSDTTHYEPNAVIAARVLNPQEDIPYLESFNKGLDARFGATMLTKEFHQFMERMLESMPQPNEIGDIAPELKLTDTSGKIVALSSLRGKYVLLDFWASWCGPCRAENPNVLEAYKKYKNKNFTILAVSLDNVRAKWLEAVHHDALLWQQVSDLKGWQSSAASKYGVHAIPSNFLLDPKGVIIAKNLRGPQLESKLEEVLK